LHNPPRALFFVINSNPFELLGLPLHFDLQRNELDARMRELSKILHPDRHAGGSTSERRLALNRAIAMNEAVRVLRDPVARGHALLAALCPGAKLEEARAEQTFLFEVMELRERLATAHKAADWTQVRIIGEQAQRAWDVSITHLTRQFAALAQTRGERADGDVDAVLAELAKLKYWQRLTEEVGRIEAEQD
jgi:molecular chaperone HscB